MRSSRDSSYGVRVDRIAGALSRILHLRAAGHDSVEELRAHYLDLLPEQMFPAPAPIEMLSEHRSALGSKLGITTFSWRSSHQVIGPEYRLRHDNEYRKNQLGWARWMRPDGRQRDHCLVYVHGWLEPSSWFEEATLFRKWGRELGVDLVHVALPFHGRRQPPGSLFSGEYFWTADLVRSIEGVRQTVCDARAVTEWLRTRGYRTVGVTGISLGGAIDMLLACLEPLPDYIVPIVAHLKLEEAVECAPILWRMKHDLEKWGVHESERRELFRRIGWSSYRPRLAPERQLWVQARDDVYIGADLVDEQWRDWSKPPILWIEGGHMTFPLHIGRITAGMAEFIARIRG